MNCISYDPNPDEDREPERRYLACHDPFWPSIDLASLRQRLALGAHISETQLTLAVHCAVAVAMDEFANWRRALRARGYRRLGDVSGHEHGRALSVCYLRLVEAGTRRTLTQQVQQAITGGGSHA